MRKKEFDRILEVVLAEELASSYDSEFSEIDYVNDIVDDCVGDILFDTYGNIESSKFEDLLNDICYFDVFEIMCDDMNINTDESIISEVSKNIREKDYTVKELVDNLKLVG